MMRGDWRYEAEQYRDVDRKAQQEAEEQIAKDEARAERAYEDAVTGINQKAMERLNKALRRVWKLDSKT